jgi:hypothetical protein
MLEGNFIARKLHSIKNAIFGALGSVEILKKLAVFGYTTERINEGKTMWENVNHLMTNQVKEYSLQYTATDEQEKFLKTTYAQYMVIVKVCRIAFKKHPDILSGLVVVGKRSRSLSGWLRHARVLYSNLLEIPGALEIIAAYGYPAEQLYKELENIAEVENLHVKQLGGKSAAQQSTQKRDEALDELCDWYSDFRAIARIALYDDPELLEALGITRKGIKN